MPPPVELDLGLGGEWGLDLLLVDGWRALSCGIKYRLWEQGYFMCFISARLFHSQGSSTLIIHGPILRSMQQPDTGVAN